VAPSSVVQRADWDAYSADFQAVRGKPQALGRRAIEFMIRQYANAEVFVLALYQAREWVRVVARHDPTPKHAMKAFTASLGTRVSRRRSPK
jgi:hypothetical protein